MDQICERSHIEENNYERKNRMGKNSWYIVDGYRPPEGPGQCEYEGHEAIMILNCNKESAHCLIDVFFEDKPPVLGIPYTASAERISCFRSNDPVVFKDCRLDVNTQYSLRIRSDIGVIVQYGRCDITQPNLAYIAALGYAE